tara:strand:+ start:1443 stop:1901 length:459 start_codon:yes stop_codon:yes gene_type:complete
MAKCNIDCMTYNKDKDMREWEVTAEGRIWPCCFFANAWEKKMSTELEIGMTANGVSFKKDSRKMNEESARLFNDTEFKKHIDKDYNFNKLSHHDLDTIVDHPYFNETVWFQGWESDTPHAICSKQCEVITDEITGEEKAKSTLTTTSKKTAD